MVSKIFYPFENPAVIRQNFKSDIIRAFKPFVDTKNRITEEKFCEVMEKIDKYIKKDNYERFVFKIFKRHDKNKDNLLDKEELEILMKNFSDPNLTDADINEIYLKMMGSSASGDGIDYKSFFKHSLFREEDY